MVRSPLLVKCCLAVLLAQLVCAARIDLRDGIQTREFPCPEAEDIVPCTCSYSADLTEYYLDCSDAKTVEELTPVFSAPFPFTTFKTLTIDQTDCTDCELTSLPAGSLGSDISFETITITGTSIATIEEEVFGASHDTLVSLHLNANQISDFPFESLGDYSSLTSLYLQANKFNTEIPPIDSDSLKIIDMNSNPELLIPANFVQAAPAIQRVQLRNGKLKEVPIYEESPIGMFTGLQNINYIDFASNFISEIQTNTIIAEAETLVTVNFSNNNISILHPEFLKGFSDSTSATLNMQSNSITLLDEQVWADIFAQLPQENSIDLSDNPLLCGCEMAWLVLSSPDLRTSLTDTTSCMGGNSPVKDLPAAPYESC